MPEFPQTDPDELFDDADAPAAQSGVPLAALTVVVPPPLAGARMDKALAQLLPDHSRSRIQAWIDAGAVIRGGEPVKVRTVVAAGDALQVTPQPSADSLAFAPEPVPLAVVYEDPVFAVIDKPAGLVVHPAAGNWSGTLLNGLLHRYPDSAQLPRAGIVHRLDKETSGLMVVARTAAAQTDLVRQLQARTVKRTYLAVVWGSIAAAGTIDRPLGRDPRDRLRIAVVPNGKPARTHFRRLQQGVCAGRPVSLVRCDLDTGRTHQIRVHLESLGHPLLGDPVYQRAVPGEIKAAVPLTRQALHATRLGLAHPVSQQPLSWRSPLPADLTQLFDGLGWADDVALD